MNKSKTNLLNALSKGPQSYTSLKKTLAITDRAIQRHLKDLLYVDLITKNKTGLYEITEKGSEVAVKAWLQMIIEKAQITRGMKPNPLPEDILERLASIKLSHFGFDGDEKDKAFRFAIRTGDKASFEVLKKLLKDYPLLFLVLPLLTDTEQAQIRMNPK